VWLIPFAALILECRGGYLKNIFDRATKRLWA
jgi:hypothetical protein